MVVFEIIILWFVCDLICFYFWLVLCICLMNNFFLIEFIGYRIGDVCEFEFGYCVFSDKSFFRVYDDYG